MPTVRDILREKGTAVQTVLPATPVIDAIHKMNELKIGALAVCQDDRLVGMFTERDVLRRVVGEGRDPATTTVSEVMTTDVVCCESGADLDEVSQIMKERRIRHVPVCDGHGKVHGLISIGDVNAVHASQTAAHLHYLSEYVYGRV